MKSTTKKKTAPMRTAAKRTAKAKPAARARRATTRVASRQKTKASGIDAIALLEADHRKVGDLLERLTSAETPSRREELLEQVKKELQMHTQIEEDHFYPAYREAAAKKEDRKLYHEAIEEHHAVDLVLPDVERADPGSDSFAGRAKVLKELVEHHVEEEERDMFPRARRLLGAGALREIGARMAEQKKRGVGGALRAVASFVGISR